MSLSSHLCLLIVVGLILPTRGQILEKPTPISPAEGSPTEITGVLTPPVGSEHHLNLHAPTPQTDEAPPTPPETQTQQPTKMDVPPSPGPGTHKSSTEAGPTNGTTPSKQSPGKDVTTKPAFKSTDSSENNPFFYDDTTLRKHGLLVAAVLFITGIVILTSGKCRRLSQLCRSYNRAYVITTKA